MTTFEIVYTTGLAHRLDPTAGPLADFDPATHDPADFAGRIWRAIENHDPIWFENHARCSYPNIAHVVRIDEAG